MARRFAGVVSAMIALCAVAGCGGGHSHAAAQAGGVGATGSGAGSSPVLNGGKAGSAGGAGSTSGPGGGAAGSGSATAGSGAAAGVIGFPVGPLLPTAVDSGQCQAAQFADKSVYAQIAVSHATCAQVPAVSADADHARGKAYLAAGFECTATAQQPSNGYWVSPYVSYNCRNGNEQIAFNWGTSSSRF